MAKKSSSVYRIIKIMLVVALISAALLAVCHKVTEQPIKQAQDNLIAEGINQVITSEFNNNPFEEKINIRRDKELFTLYPARKDGYITSIVMKSHSNKGFGGRLDVIVGFLLDGTVSGFQVVKHQETPGLGSKVNEPTFKKGVIGKNPANENFKVRQDGGEIDAITGATITSRALIDAIQKAYRGYLKFNAGSENE